MNAIHIDRLHFRGREAQRRIFLSDLDYAAWPSVGEKEYLFIRSLHVRKTASQLAAELAGLAASCRQVAVNPWVSEAADAEAVYFPSHAELLACLSRDLLQGRKRWYWREWAHWFERPVDEALFDCWYQHKATLPSIVAELARKAELRTVWRRLSQSVSERLLLALNPQTNFRTRSTRPVQSDTSYLPAYCLTPWLEVFAEGDWPAASRQLAALLVLWQWRPLVLLQADSQPIFQAVLQAFDTSAVAEAMPDPDKAAPERHAVAAGGTMAAEGARLMDGSRPPASSARASALGAVIPDQMIAVSARSDAGRRSDATVTENYANVAAGTALSFPDSLPDGKGADPGLRQLEFEPQSVHRDLAGSISRCASSQAGVFYLLNFLNLEPVRQRLLNDEAALAFPSAWGWLYRLAEALNWQPDPALRKLFAFLCGFEQVEQLQHLPVLPNAEALLHLGIQRYGGELFNSELCAVAGLIEVDACYVDVYFDINAAKLEVRRAGLDVDPGWLPWLGKVLRFHYQPMGGGSLTP